MIRRVRALLFGAILPAFVFAQARPVFDVTSVKPSAPKSPYEFRVLPGSHLVWVHTNVALVIRWAYELRKDQLIGGPDWIRSKAFDFDAKCDPPVGDYRTMTPEQSEATQHQVRLRLQSLLAERFQLKLREESRQMPVYELVVDKNGPKLQESSKLSPDGNIKQGAIVRPGYIEAYHVPMDILARALSQYAGRVVVDRTGLTGRYDLKLNWTPDNAVPQPPDANGANNANNQLTEASGLSLFTATHEQLGLSLQPSKDAVTVFVVQNVTLPEAN